MATVALASSKVLSRTPFFLTELTVTTGVTAADLAHGCPREPEVVWVQSVGAIDTANEVTIVSKDSDTINVDCEDDGNNSVKIYCLCLSQASGGFSSGGETVPLTSP